MDDIRALAYDVTDDVRSLDMNPESAAELDSAIVGQPQAAAATSATHGVALE